MLRLTLHSGLKVTPQRQMGMVKAIQVAQQLDPKNLGEGNIRLA